MLHGGQGPTGRPSCPWGAGLAFDRHSRPSITESLGTSLTPCRTSPLQLAFLSHKAGGGHMADGAPRFVVPEAAYADVPNVRAAHVVQDRGLLSGGRPGGGAPDRQLLSPSVSTTIRPWGMLGSEPLCGQLGFLLLLSLLLISLLWLIPCFIEAAGFGAALEPARGSTSLSTSIWRSGLRSHRAGGTVGTLSLKGFVREPRGTHPSVPPGCVAPGLSLSVGLSRTPVASGM